MKNRANRLINEHSPYLLQHAYNPVDWYPWGEEAFEKAKAEDKPVLLSIGYSACHWCHVMERESFSDPDIAAAINRVFVPVKVDREDRPDLDKLFMAVCEMLSETGGWPLHIIMTSDKKPFFATTYIPKLSTSNRIGLLELTSRMKKLWTYYRNDLLTTANNVLKDLSRLSDLGDKEVLPSTVMNDTFLQLSHQFDEEFGGFGAAPKFPMPHTILFLLNHYTMTGNNRSLEMAEKTLQSIHQGGIFDHLGFGFHRYSADRKWHVPHFEKMLYDQAMLTMAYTIAYQVTKHDLYKEIAQNTIEYVLRDMVSLEGGFYASQDADSEGEDGRFYLWSYDEIVELLGLEESKLFISLFSVEKEGNYYDEASGKKTGKNILFMKKPLSSFAREKNMKEADLKKLVAVMQEILYAVRSLRTIPGKNTKILADWNGLMIAALAKAAQVFEEPRYYTVAKRAADYISRTMMTIDNRLMHSSGDDSVKIATVDDYSFFMWGLVELYETAFDPDNLMVAVNLSKGLISHYWDKDNGGFFMTADDGEILYVRQKELYDNAIPSGNSVAMLVLIMLSRMTGDVSLEDKAHEIPMTFSKKIKQTPAAYTQFMIAKAYEEGPSYEIVIVGDPSSPATEEMIAIVHQEYISNRVVLFRLSEGAKDEILSVAPYLAEYKSVNGKSTVYICKNYTCQSPVTEIQDMLRLLDIEPARAA
ncbi:MAG: thioredoxin domain-containing protein [Candidatus Margulisiibacteriota bacterium]|nr:MAG: thioredoxin [Candidatus Margulisbacteria bacterium GWD2_39_127]OGI03189.1 MAG: thioredoxin [Candidatus Margulisbacteria bacterium GWF2_38_17]OGI11213.1 MAG: thioredoxin [Candidatus Margulisbacteria bacterium GWE2_39_32]PZM78571.1 MAG: thioredoxin domain-containing protein [Candidatus Margulisiibacteriota bacterium]HAR63861.1 thioredoxin domain-containing protein [Candidatus Margulisiibacteriota bacterium]